MPESLPATFFHVIFPEVISNFGLKVESFLLHSIIGWGFPLAEHCNEAASFSFTLSVEGEIPTTGDEIDSPGSPFIPGLPVTPGGPVCPFFPGSPLCPRGPMMPCFPPFPGDPMIPSSPFIPFLPLLPRDPFVPRGPGWPGGPGGPCEQECFAWQSFITLSDSRLSSLTTNWSLSLFSVVFKSFATFRLILMSFAMSEWIPEVLPKRRTNMNSRIVRLIKWEISKMADTFVASSHF